MRAFLRGFWFVVLLSSSSAFATHLAGGSMTWERDQTFVSPTHVRHEVTLRLNVRRSFPWPIANPNVGDTFLTHYSVTITPTGGPQSNQTLSMTVISVNAAEDWMILERKFAVTTHLAQFPVRVLWESGDRLATLVDANRSRPARLWVDIDAANLRSTTSTLLPRIYLSLNQPNSFYIPATTVGMLRTQFAPLVDSLLAVQSPPGMTLTASGLVSWTPTTAGLYAVQFSLFDVNSFGAVTNRVPLDVIFEVVNTATAPTVSFGSTCPTSVAAYTGLESRVDLVATGTNLGANPISIVSGPLPVGASFEASGASASYRWTPGRAAYASDGTFLAAEPQRACFQASAPGALSLGACCIDTNVNQPQPQRVLTGTFRDFAVAHPDFSRADGDQIVSLVEPVLGPTRKPVRSAATSTTITSAASFATWWNDTTSGGQVRPSRAMTLVLTNALDSDVNRFTFNSTRFYPVDQFAGSSDPSPNRFFTWEAHTTMPYLSGAQLTFKSADDLWVFINGRLVVNRGGVRAASSFVLSMDSIAASAGLVAGDEYPVDIFYAHRGSSRHPELGVQLSYVPASSCLTSQPRAPATFSFLGSGRVQGSAVRLQTAGDVLGVSAAYLTQRVPLDDFMLDFDVTTTAVDGFAVVLAPAPVLGPTVERREEVSATTYRRIVDAGTLGYSGVPSTVAVEFDSAMQPAFSDPGSQHIAVMSRGVLANSSDHVLAQRGVAFRRESECWWPYESCGGPLVLAPQTSKHVRVSWTRSREGLGWLRVWQGPISPVLVPELEVELTTAELVAMFPTGSMSLGLTSGHGVNTLHMLDGGVLSGGSIAGNIDVSNVVLSSVMPGAQTFAMTLPPPASLVSAPVTMRVRLSSACGPMSAGGFASSLTATALRSGVPTTATVQDVGAGLYDVTYTPNVPGTWALMISVGGSSIVGAPFVTTVVPRCGDGATHSPEQCDDGNQVDNDACTNACTTPRCGDSIQQSGEQCDDGNAVNDDACSNACTTPRCGDSITQSGEQCDDGNAVNDDACSNACTTARCGDSITQAPEQCDDGNAVNDDACSDACTTARCGDSITQAPEQCDDGNAVNNDACSDACTTARCGDSITQAPEQCDDGNAVNNDACSNACASARCGDSITQAPEQCDDGNAVNNDACSDACTSARCGDSITQAPEQCDDGNAVNDDTCSNACASARCGDSITQAPEQCDDGNAVNDDACSNACASARCGDSITQAPEQCDDGNTTAGDGCSAACVTELIVDAGTGGGTGGGSATGGGVATGGGDATGGGVATGGGNATGGGGDVTPMPTGCGCTSSGGEVIWLLAGLLGLRRRKKQNSLSL